MSGKDSLLRNKELTSWWVSVAHDDRFELLMTHVRAELAETSEGWDRLKGANAALDLIATITDSDHSSAIIPTSGIDHNFNKPKSDTEEKKDNP